MTTYAFSWKELYYELAAGRLNVLPNGKYGDMVRHGVKRGLQRVG